MAASLSALAKRLQVRKNAIHFFAKLAPLGWSSFF
jgi:hypothetical protein